MLWLSVASVLATTAFGHGAVTLPKPRQAIDHTLPPWNGPVPDPIPFTNPNWCAHPEANSTDKRGLSGSNGQACFWFNNGCDIGCDKCDGTSGQNIPCCTKKFHYKGFDGQKHPATGWNAWTSPNIVPDPEYVAKFNRSKMRPKHVKYPDRKATICDKRLRTVNTNAECGAPDDFWYHHPWRYPGISPVTDGCGTAGGVLPGQGQGGAGASYTDTKFVTHGDLGSKLPPLDTGVVWKAGESVEVSWNLKAWHGGGYTYRLAPADAPLTEAAFQKMPLKFVGNSSLRWGGVGGEQLFFNSTEKGWEVTGAAVFPTNSVWRKNPIPHTVNEWFMYGATFEPVCQESEACSTSYDKAPTRDGPGNRPVCHCSGDWNDAVEIVDRVQIPADLKPGKWVLGWRWDCEVRSKRAIVLSGWIAG
jgi:hypothetical protein